MNDKFRSVVLLVLAQTMVLSLWFVSSAILADMSREVEISAFARAAMSSSVQAGFVVGALVVAISGIADRIDPRIVLGISASVAAVANVSLLAVTPGGSVAIALRFLTGIMMAGVYPVGMKIAVGWGTKDRGFLVGLLVGGVTLGSASPHLLAWFGGANWRITICIASMLAGLGAASMFLVKLGPHHRAAPTFSADAIRVVWQDRRIRSAYCGYFGHMWELYAMWAWISVALSVSFTHQMANPSQVAKLITFLAIAAGGVASAGAGWVADRIGRAELSILAMLLSGTSAIAFAVFFGGSPWLVGGIAIFWGLTIVPDSAQFSALIADFAPAEQAGSVMTLQTALGYGLTIFTVQITPIAAEAFGWQAVFGSLAIGPTIGIYSMWNLRQKSSAAERAVTPNAAE